MGARLAAGGHDFGNDGFDRFAVAIEHGNARAHITNATPECRIDTTRAAGDDDDLFFSLKPRISTLTRK